jgi:hypothetical protein
MSSSSGPNLHLYRRQHVTLPSSPSLSVYTITSNGSRSRINPYPHQSLRAFHGVRRPPHAQHDPSLCHARLPRRSHYVCITTSVRNIVFIIELPGPPRWCEMWYRCEYTIPTLTSAPLSITDSHTVHFEIASRTVSNSGTRSKPSSSSSLVLSSSRGSS